MEHPRPADAEGSLLRLVLTIESWHPLQGRLRIAGEQQRTHAVHGWSGLAGVLTALERNVGVDEPGA